MYKEKFTTINEAKCTNTTQCTIVNEAKCTNTTKCTIVNEANAQMQQNEPLTVDEVYLGIFSKCIDFLEDLNCT